MFDPLRLVSAHSLLNLESFAALGFLVAILARSSSPASSSSAAKSLDAGIAGRHWTVYILLPAAILLFYWPVLSAPFLYDDYTHITDARNADWRSIAAAFGPVENPPGLFYRPFGFLVYWLNYLIAGPDPRLWHAVSILFHAVNTCLLYSLCRKLQLSAAGGMGAALLFAFSGSAAEPVAWIDARFDPMATGLVLASLLCVCRFLDGGRTRWMAAACLAGVAAFTSKESAFCLPLLVGCLWFFRPAAEGSSPKRLTAAFLITGVLAAGIFAYRWWALGGIGGYRGQSGDSGIAGFSLVRMLNAVLVRDWTILFFPVNWSSPVNWSLAAVLSFTPIILALCVWRSDGIRRRRAITGAIAMTILAAIPAQHLLLIGADLANSRYLYLPSIGWAVLWGVIFTSMRDARWRWLTIGWMLCHQMLIAHHNLAFWLRVPEEARAVCAEFARTVSAINGTAVVGGLPQRRDGVVFLANGFPQCVEMNGGPPPGKITVFGTPNFAWNAATGRIEPISK